MKLYITTFLFLFSFTLLAQDTDDDAPAVAKENSAYPKTYYLLSPRVSVTSPHPINNKSFRKTFAGVYEVSAGLNLYLFEGIFIGGTYKTGQFKITANKIPNYEASMAINNAGFKIGNDMYLGDNNKIIFSGAITIGNNWTKYSGLVSKDPTQPPIHTSFTTAYIEPELNLYFLIEPNFGIGGTITYDIYNHTFDPYELRLNDWAQYDAATNGTTQYLSFGFTMCYNLFPKKK